MDKPFNQMTPAEVELIALVAEEHSEVSEACMKSLRHGFESYSPFDPEKMTNREWLEKELGHAIVARDLLLDKGIVRMEKIFEARDKKREEIQQWLHHNSIDPQE